MREDYLWDRSGEPDPEVERLEKLLGRFRSDGPAPDLTPRVAEFPRRSWWMPRWQAIAAGLLLAAAGAWVLTRPVTPAWEVARLEEGGARQTGSLAVGQWLETGSRSRAKIQVGRIGEVDVEPNTLLRLVAARWTNHRLALERGEIRARIWAPPRLFFVQTPSALATDLGCAYTLKVGDDGAGLLEVTHGRVSFELAGKESFVVAGARCLTRPGLGPGTPYYTDSTEAFQASLTKLDFGDGGAGALDVVLGEARRRDVLTLWHLLARLPETDRGRVFDRMSALVEIPPEVDREAVLGGDRRAHQALWDELGLEEAGWWQ